MFTAHHAQQFRLAKPFPHIALPALWPHEVLDAAIADFPPVDSPTWKSYTGEREGGKQEQADTAPYPGVQALVSRLRHPSFINDLERLTGLSGLSPDQWGGGMHQVAKGGRLALHADFTRSPNTGLYRRLNVLVFLNKGWHISYGGALILGNPQSGPLRAIAPQYGITAIFATSATSWHGHPDPWKVATPRRSVAMYYYSEVPPDDYPGDRSTEWL